MRAAALTALMLLAACASPDRGAGRRDPAMRISSAALFDAARFAGRWHVVQSHAAGCAGAVQDWRMEDVGSYSLSGTDCAGPAPAALAGRAVVTGPGGRITAQSAFARQPVYVLWVDEGYRIAALGTPSGEWGMVLSRSPAPRPDLMRAAQEVLAFNGYDPARFAPR